MSRTIFIISFLFFIIFECNGQLCGECDTQFFLKDTHARYWQDPDGLVYEVGQIQQPNKLGLWTYFKMVGETQEIISIRNVTCLELLDGRSKQIQDSEIKIYPNPSSAFVTIEQPHSETVIEFRDIKGVLLLSQISSKSKETRVDISSFQSGMYIINIIAGKLKYNKLFIVQ